VRLRPVVLCVLDGFGLLEDANRNALMAAAMWNWRRILDEWPSCRLQAAGEAVGLPAGQMGNSEVGHLNLGAGFPVIQDLPRISRAINDGSFYENRELTDACRHAVEHESRLHLIGLIGPGGIHAVDEHIVAIAELAHRSGLPADRVFLHAFTDGRDTPPRSAAGFIKELGERLGDRATIASVTGRYYAMDRDQRWDRTRRAYDALVHGDGLQAGDALAAVHEAYQRDVSDEFIEPTLVEPEGTIRDGDAVVDCNFGADRARQLTHALARDYLDYFDGGQLKSVGSYLLGQEDGTWGLFYDNKQLTQEEFWKYGRLINVSEYNTYDGSSTLDPGTLKDGDGTRITYYINGQKESEGNYKSGHPDGQWKYYHDNGRLASEGDMENGKKEGPWKYYSRAGNLEDIINFKNDEVILDEEPQPNGLFQDFN
jgi:hypothetical protein